MINHDVVIVNFENELNVIIVDFETYGWPPRKIKENYKIEKSIFITQVYTTTILNHQVKKIKKYSNERYNHISYKVKGYVHQNSPHTLRINELKYQIKDILEGGSSNQPVKKTKQRTKY